MTFFKFLFLVFCLSTWAFSQHVSDHEISVSIGRLANQELKFNKSDYTVKGFSENKLGRITLDKSSTFSAAYKFALNGHLKVYLEGSYQRLTDELWVDGTAMGQIEDKFTTLGLGLEFRYFSIGWFSCYSGFAMANTFIDSQYDGSQLVVDTKNRSFFNYQLDLLGFKFGNYISLFTELGFGYQGQLVVGASIGF